MAIQDFRTKYKGKSREQYNKCIRAEFEGGEELMELRRYVSYLRNVKPIWGEPGETHQILKSILRQTPQMDRFNALRNFVTGCLDTEPLAGGIDETRRILGKLETLLSNIRNDMIAEIKDRYNF